MKPDEQVVAIAQACGYARCINQDGIGYGAYAWIKPGLPAVPYDDELPDYLSDLNAMHEARKQLKTEEENERYFYWLTELTGSVSAAADATACQRAEAFLRAKNLWKA